MKFLVDQQLPEALCTWLAERGHGGSHVRNVGMRDAPDGDLWRWAVAHATVIVTKDEDFPLRRAGLNTGPQILWIRFGNVTNRRLFGRLAPLWDGAEVLLLEGEPIVEIA